MSGRVETIFVCARGGAPMQQVAEVDAVANGGLRGDRYMERTGYWTGVDECQVTLIQGETLEEIGGETGISVGNGEHRRNLVTRGVALNSLIGRRFRIGDVLFEYDRPRPPCGYIQKITEKGMTRALGGARAGICVRVVEGGTLRAGDALVLED